MRNKNAKDSSGPAPVYFDMEIGRFLYGQVHGHPSGYVVCQSFVLYWFLLLQW
jgi:hypothetical protein